MKPYPSVLVSEPTRGSRRAILAALSLLLLVAVAPAQAGPRERDVFYAFVDGEVRYASRRVQVSKLEDGNFRFRTTFRMLVDFLGQKQESESESEYVVTAALRLVSLTLESSGLEGRNRVSGTVKEGTLTLHVESSGLTTTTTVSGLGDAIISECLSDWLAGLPPGTEQATVETIDESTWKIVTVTAKRIHRDADGATWEVQMGDMIGAITMSMDAGGTLRETVSRAPAFHMVRSTEADTRDLDYLSMNGRQVLSFPIDAEINAPHRLERIRVRVSWKDIPFEQFRLEDGRQRVIERSTTDGVESVVLEITKPRAPTPGASLPVEHPALLPFLAETRFIKPKNDEILAAARGAAEGKTGTLEVVRALSEWVHGYVQPELITTTLSGPEVLAAGKGKCSEYSTLFASMARSLGVPTRVVLGERMVPGQWTGHMWNEAWVGKWITVDASANEVGESMALLKFIHSDTVMGTQALRFKLTESLAISVEDIVLRPSNLAKHYKTGIIGRVYTNVDHACRLEAPEGWTLQDKSALGSTTIQFKVPGADAVSIHFVAFPLPPGTLPKLIVDARLSTWRSRYDDFLILESAPAEMPGAIAHIARSSGLSRSTPPVHAFITEVVWIRGPHGFLLTMVGPAADQDEHSPGFEKLLQSFKSLE